MIKHIVFFKFDNGTDEQKEELKSRLLGLKSKIDYLRELEVGINFTDSDRAYDMSLITLFDSVEDLQKYAVQSDHVELVEFIKSLKIVTKVVDYVV